MYDPQTNLCSVKPYNTLSDLYSLSINPEATLYPQSNPAQILACSHSPAY